jgi:hypothetical protein
MPNDETCEDCRFWFDLNKEDGAEVGWCRKLPPVIDHAVSADEENVERYTFPTTLSDDWCGEYKEKPHET